MKRSEAKSAPIKITSINTPTTLAAREEFFRLYKNCPIPDRELLGNLGLFVKRQSMQRILFMNELYEKILNVNGIIVEFGVRWGQNLALFSAFRGIYEPYNHGRKIVGFDTFGGFPSPHVKDGKADIISRGAFSVTEGYAGYLEKVLTYHEQESPMSHVRKHELVEGDATVTIEKYLKNNPQTIIALAYFDFDLYEPTKKCLEAIRGHVTKGTVIGFDELNDREYPGETEALKEVWGLDRYALRRSRFNSIQSYLVIE